MGTGGLQGPSCVPSWVLSVGKPCPGPPLCRECVPVGWPEDTLRCWLALHGRMTEFLGWRLSEEGVAKAQSGPLAGWLPSLGCPSGPFPTWKSSQVSVLGAQRGPGLSELELHPV